MIRIDIATAALISVLTVPASGGSSDMPYLGYAGKRWASDYGVLDGRCNRQEVGAALGAPGARPSGAARGADRKVATVSGNVLGAAAAIRKGRDMDDADRACLGQALELGGSERGVAWLNADTGTAFLVVPLQGFADHGRACREFVTQIVSGGDRGAARRRACSTGQGEWQILGFAAAID